MGCDVLDGVRIIESLHWLKVTIRCSIQCPMTTRPEENWEEGETVSCSKMIWSSYMCNIRMEPVFSGLSVQLWNKYITSFNCCYFLNYACSVFNYD